MQNIEPPSIEGLDAFVSVRNLSRLILAVTLECIDLIFYDFLSPEE